MPGVPSARVEFRAYLTAAAVRFARETLGVRRITAHCDTRNTPSYKLMEKLGMRRVSTGPRLYPQTGELAEEYTYIL